LDGRQGLPVREKILSSIRRAQFFNSIILIFNRVILALLVTKEMSADRVNSSPPSNLVSS
jgi:hypothetical protein